MSCHCFIINVFLFGSDPLRISDSEEDSKHHSGADLSNGLSSAAFAVRKKRKSSAEKFLEDNSDYYGIQVLPHKLRSTSNENFHISFLDFLQKAKEVSGCCSAKSETGH
jgi:hypothetical protein